MSLNDFICSCVSFDEMSVIIILLKGSRGRFSKFVFDRLYVNEEVFAPFILQWSWKSIAEQNPSASSWWMIATLSSSVILSRNSLACCSFISGIYFLD